MSKSEDARSTTKIQCYNVNQHKCPDVVFMNHQSLQCDHVKCQSYIFKSWCFWVVPFSASPSQLDMEQPWSAGGPCRSWQALPCPLPSPGCASSSHTVARCTYSAARRGTHVRPGAPHRALPSHPPPSGTLQPARPPDPPSRFTALQLPSLHFLGISQHNHTLNFTLKVSI